MKKRMQQAARGLLRLGIAGALVAVSACGKHVYNRTDLEMDLTRYHMNLRWERLGVAMGHVHPELRSAFAEEWERRNENIKLQSLEVLNLSFVDEDTALVQVKVQYVDNRRLKLKTMLIEEKWVRSERGWVLMRVPEIPAFEDRVK